MLIALALALAAPTDAPLDLHLICSGMGSQVKADSQSVTLNDNSGYNSTATLTGSHSEAVIDDVRIDLVGDGGRIRIPPPMLPPVRGGKDGWFDLHEVVASGDEITAKASINPFNHIKLRIDRLTGRAAFTVLRGQYHGVCQPFTPATQRAF